MTIWDTGRGCACPSAHSSTGWLYVMTVGPERPVRSWSWESFSAMEMRGASITCREEREGSELHSSTCSLATASLSMQVSPAHPKLSSPDQRLLWAHSLSSGTSDRENAKLQWCCCHPLPVLYPKIHISTGQGNPKFFSLSEWRIFNLFVNYGTVS